MAAHGSRKVILAALAGNSLIASHEIHGRRLYRILRHALRSHSLGCRYWQSGPLALWHEALKTPRRRDSTPLAMAWKSISGVLSSPSWFLRSVRVFPFMKASTR